MAGPASIDLRDYIRNIPDFPKPGIMFKDITPLLGNPLAFRAAIEQLEQHFQGRGIDVIAAAEARGFIFGAPLAMRDGRGVRADPQAGKAAVRHDRPGISARVRQRPARSPHRRPRRRAPRAAARRRAGHRRHHARLPRSGPVHRGRARRLRVRDRALVPGRPCQARACESSVDHVLMSSALITLT